MRGAGGGIEGGSRGAPGRPDDDAAPVVAHRPGKRTLRWRLQPGGGGPATGLALQGATRTGGVSALRSQRRAARAPQKNC